LVCAYGIRGDGKKVLLYLGMGNKEFYDAGFLFFMTW